jgi:Predicted pPIWI-associating nuclease
MMGGMRTVPQPVFLGVQEFVQTGLHFLEQPLDEAPTSLLAHVPAELFRALDLDSALQSTSESPAVAERAGRAAQTSDELEALLESREPELVSILRGARQAVHSQNADKARHVCISLREMLGHALRRLAPDQAVGAWTADPTHYHQGRPTRRARLEFLYSSMMMFSYAG